LSSPNGHINIALLGKTMAQYSQIMADEYNAVRTKVKGIVETGTGDKGYGGTMSSSDVQKGDMITELQFDNLRGDIDKAVRHQTGLVSALTNVSSGTVIYWATLVSYDLKADEITTNRDNVYTGATTGSYVKQLDVVNGGSTTLSSGWGVNASNQTKGTQSYNITFTTSDKARYFFNSGGYLKLTFSRNSPGSPNTKTVGWQGIIDNMQTQAFTFDKTKYRQGVAGTTTVWSYTKNDTTNPYQENYGYMRFKYVDSTTIGVSIQLIDVDTGDQTGIGPAVDETVGIDITAGLEYRKSIDQFVAETPTFTIPAWTLSASTSTTA
jgi:hypothetical protein